MASSDFLHLTSFLLLLLLLLISTTNVAVSDSGRRRSYESIISFGDSIADTGNLLRLTDPNKVPLVGLPPYGETFFHFPTGRFSDGRLIIDFIAEYLGLPLVPPYYGSPNKNFEKGINFAVGGATALNDTMLEEKGIPCNVTNISLDIQLRDFKNMLPTICGSSADCKEFLDKSLILMGEIGGNDFNYPFFAGNDIQIMKELVPVVIDVISLAIEDLIKMGGKTFLVPGNFPIGCNTAYLTLYQTTNVEDIDLSTGCLRWFNEFTQLYNKELQTELNRLQMHYPHTHIRYADYYNPVLRIYQDPAKYGFKERPLDACCGMGGPYNYSVDKRCGNGVPYCDDPSKYVNWDGIHMTEAAYRWIAQSLLEGLFEDLPSDYSNNYSKIENESSSYNDKKALSI